jgi:hypothetical protein
MTISESAVLKRSLSAMAWLAQWLKVFVAVVGVVAVDVIDFGSD